MSNLKEKLGDWNNFIDYKELLRIGNFLNDKYVADIVTPSKDDTFKAFELCSYSNCRIIMIGYDPYPQRGVATGLLFGNKKETDEKNWSPSLNIIKNSCIDWTFPHNTIIFDPSLESWAKQGILLINSALTTEINNTGSHINLWRPLISKFLYEVSNTNTGLIYVLFGEQAKTLKPYINHKVNHILEEKHPAFYSRTKVQMPPNIFKDINRITKNINGERIRWYEEE